MKQAFLVYVIATLLCSCASYKQNIMFKTDQDFSIKKEVLEANKNYVIQKNNSLKLDVFTKDGELIIDPELQLLKDIPQQNAVQRIEPEYLVNVEGIAKFPMVGEIKLEGLTIREAEALLQQEYSKFYKDAFVILQFANNRVVVLGAPGGKVIPLLNENVTLIEVIALASGADNNAKVQNIKILRGDDVMVADLSTIEGYKMSNIVIQPNDIIYIEPIRRPAIEAIRDYGPIISIITSIAALVVVLIGVN